MKDIPIIVWEKWIDPFGQELDDAKWTDYENKIDNSLNEIEYEDDYEDVDEEHQVFGSDKEIKVIATPMGLIPYNELTAPGKIFNFWVAHTNFNISPPVSKIIEETEGVEILDIFTRYRFRVSIGKCFNASETMKSINDNVYSFLGLKEHEQQ
jgi:hypothetical protein